MPRTGRTDLTSLRQLDPARHLDTDPEATQAALDVLRRRLHDDPTRPSTAIDLVSGIRTEPAAPGGAGPRRKRRSHRARVRAAAALTTAATVATVTAFLVTSGDHTGPATSAGESAVAQWAPLARGATVACPDDAVPVDALAADPVADDDRSPTAAALRAFLSDNPFAGMGSVTTSNWALLQQTPERLIFGQREGALGVVAVVVLERGASGYTATRLDSCSHITLPTGEAGSVVTSAHTDGDRLTLTWDAASGMCASNDTLKRVEIDQTTAAVHVLVVVEHHPPATPLPPGTACAGVATAADTPSATVTLDAPLGDRPLYDDGRVSATPLHVT